MVASLTPNEAILLRALDRDGPFSPSELRGLAVERVSEVRGVLEAQGLVHTLHGRDGAGDPTAWTRITPAGRTALDGEFDPPPRTPDPNRPHTTPFNQALLLYMASVGRRGEARRLAKRAYFDAQDAVPPHLIDVLVAKCERKRLEIQMRTAGRAGALARAA